MTKKSIIIAFILAVLLCTQTAGAAIPSIDDTSLLPPVAGRGEMFSNSSFEADGGWSLHSGSSYSTDFSYDGERSIRMDVQSPDYTHISQGKTGLLQGAVYQISARIYQPEAKGDFRIGNEYYGNGYSWIGHENWKRELTEGSWTQVSATFTVPAETRYTIIYFWLYSVGNKAYIDDVSLVMIKEPERVSVTTDQIYYYTNDDVTKGTVRLRVNSSQYPEYNTWKATVSLVDSDSEVVYSKDNISVDSTTLDIDYPIYCLTDRNNKYTVKVSIYTDDGILEEHNNTVYRKFQRPSMIDSEGNFVVNGEVFVPVIGYWVYNQSDFYAQAKQMGINVIETTWGMMDKPDMVIAELDRLQANGFMGIVSLYYQEETGWNEKYREDTKNLISRIKDHPAIFAYSLMDEPIAKKIDLNELGGAYEYIRGVDTVHPIYACDMFANSTELLSKYHDMVCFDKYPVSSASALDYVSDCYKEAEFYIRNQKKPKLSILRFYQDSSTMYFPSADDMRNMLYQNYILGAKGHGFYPIGWTNITDPESGETIRNLDSSAATAIKGWSSGESEFFKNAFITVRYNPISSVLDDSYECYIFECDEEVYLAVRNKTMSQIEISVKNIIFSEGMEVLGVYGTSNAINLHDGVADVTLNPQGAYLYHLASENKKILLAEHEEATYGYTLYKHRGKLCIDAVNKTTYVTKTVTIENSLIKADMLIEHLSGDGSSVSELAEGRIKIKVLKNTTVSYALVTDTGRQPVPYRDGIVINSLTGGDTINVKSFNGLTTFLVLYDENGLVTIAKSGSDGIISLTLPETINQKNYIKLMRWRNIIPVSRSVLLDARKD